MPGGVMHHLLITDDATREELAEALGHVNRSAKRAQHIVEKFSDDPPTDWTMCHRRLDALLDQMLKGD